VSRAVLEQICVLTFVYVNSSLVCNFSHKSHIICLQKIKQKKSTYSYFGSQN